MNKSKKSHTLNSESYLPLIKQTSKFTKFPSTKESTQPLLPKVMKSYTKVFENNKVTLETILTASQFTFQQGGGVQIINLEFPHLEFHTLHRI